MRKNKLIIKTKARWVSRLFRSSFENFTHHIEVDVVTLIDKAAVQRAVVTGERVPGTVEVISHDIYKVEKPVKTAKLKQPLNMKEQNNKENILTT